VPVDMGVYVFILFIDIPRTFPNNIYFRDRSKDPQTKRSSLYKILVAVAHNNQQIGYCQVCYTVKVFTTVRCVTLSRVLCLVCFSVRVCKTVRFVIYCQGV